MGRPPLLTVRGGWAWVRGPALISPKRQPVPWGPGISSAFSIVTQFREKSLRGRYCCLNTSDLFFATAAGTKGAGSGGLGGRRGTRVSFSLLVNFHLLCMQDESRKYFCYQIFRRVCRKVLRGHVDKLFWCSLVQQVCIKCTSSCFS